MNKIKVITSIVVILLISILISTLIIDLPMINENIDENARLLDYYTQNDTSYSEISAAEVYSEKISDFNYEYNHDVIIIILCHIICVLIFIYIFMKIKSKIKYVLILALALIIIGNTYCSYHLGHINYLMKNKEYRTVDVNYSDNPIISRVYSDLLAENNLLIDLKRIKKQLTFHNYLNNMVFTTEQQLPIFKENVTHYLVNDLFDKIMWYKMLDLVAVDVNKSEKLTIIDIIMRLEDKIQKDFLIPSDTVKKLVTLKEHVEFDETNDKIQYDNLLQEVYRKIDFDYLFKKYNPIQIINPIVEKNDNGTFLKGKMFNRSERPLSYIKIKSDFYEGMTTFYTDYVYITAHKNLMPNEEMEFKILLSDKQLNVDTDVIKIYMDYE